VPIVEQKRRYSLTNLKANTIAQNVISQLIFTHANFMVEARIKRHDDKEAEILFKADAK
jgi:hypothetical protein